MICDKSKTEITPHLIKIPNIIWIDIGKFVEIKDQHGLIIVTKDEVKV